MILLCKFCGKECKNKNSLINHERLCKLNPNKQVSSLAKYWESNTSAWNAGLKGKNDPRCKLKESTKEKLKGFSGKALTPEKELARVAKIRNKIIKRYEDGWEPVCGRCKKYDYESPVAGKIKVDGTWELLVAKYLDKIGVKWQRNRLRFNYIKPNGSRSTYQPDFYVDDWNTFLEVKGYETELDRAKWKQFEAPLLVWKKKEIQQLEI